MEKLKSLFLNKNDDPKRILRKLKFYQDSRTATAKWNKIARSTFIQSSVFLAVIFIIIIIIAIISILLAPTGIGEITFVIDIMLMILLLIPISLSVFVSIISVNIYGISGFLNIANKFEENIYLKKIIDTGKVSQKTIDKTLNNIKIKTHQN